MGLRLHSHKPSGVALIDRLALCRLNIQAVDDLDGPADIGRALFRIERHVGSKEDSVRPKELHAADRRLLGPEDRCVGIEETEIIERPLFQFFQQVEVVLIRGPCAQLVPARVRHDLRSRESCRPGGG